MQYIPVAAVPIQGFPTNMNPSSYEVWQGVHFTSSQFWIVHVQFHKPLAYEWDGSILGLPHFFDHILVQPLLNDTIASENLISITRHASTLDLLGTMSSCRSYAIVNREKYTPISRVKLSFIGSSWDHFGDVTTSVRCYHGSIHLHPLVDKHSYWKWPSRNRWFTHEKMVIFHSFWYVYQRVVPIFAFSQP